MVKTSLKERLVAIVAAGVIASAMALPAMAFAEDAQPANNDNQPSAGAQSGSGTTALNMITADDGSEHSESSNNLMFTFPSSINYVVAADGAMTGPDGTAAYIDNNSDFQIHTSSVDVDATQGWNFIANIANAGSTANSVQLNIGPTGHQINAASYLTDWSDPDNVLNLEAAVAPYWGMAADGAASSADQLPLDSSGAVANVTADITQVTKFGEITWYVKAGPAPTV